ncbi:hypothetical protein [Streptomyces sp. NPDC059611]|uniref:hypothetical protein n=1 Tax=Streptomyces sp. NPDC059611 TaxID=3346884 RepID=UPI0036A73992
MILSRFSADTLQLLAPMAGPAPNQSKNPGRFHVIQQGDVHETQALLMSDADVVNWLTDPTDSAS